MILQDYTNVAIIATPILTIAFAAYIWKKQFNFKERYELASQVLNCLIPFQNQFNNLRIGSYQIEESQKFENKEYPSEYELKNMFNARVAKADLAEQKLSQLNIKCELILDVEIAKQLIKLNAIYYDFKTKFSVYVNHFLIESDENKEERNTRMAFLFTRLYEKDELTELLQHEVNTLIKMLETYLDINNLEFGNSLFRGFKYYNHYRGKRNE